jgi:MYXO-CTERM domain-containing protein
MTSTTFKRLSLSLGFLAIAVASASTAQAQSCKDTTECPKGFVCEQYATPLPSPAPTPAVDGGAAPTASDLPASSSGAAYPADIAPAMGGACRPAPCTADSQCGAGMVCLSSKTSECTAPAIACAPGSKCDLPAPTCVDKIVSTCAYKWQLPCTTDLDCGANFVCNPSVTSSCSGGGGTGTPGTSASDPAGVPRDLIAPAPPPDQMCTTTTSFPGYCQPKATTCTTDAECPAAWPCKAIAATTPVTDGPTRAPAVDGGTTSSGNSSNAGVAPPEALPKPPEETVKVCVSPLGYGGTAYPTRPVDTKGDGSNTGNPEPATPPTGNPATGESADDSPKAGCAVGGSAGSSFALLAFGLVGLALARRRRT